jgi:hypothetical protein
MNTFCDACDALLRSFWRGGADPTTCDGCGKGICSDCAETWDADGGYGDGSTVKVRATCATCEGETPCATL